MTADNSTVGAIHTGDWECGQCHALPGERHTHSAPVAGESVRIPTSADEAALMALLGTNYLEQHAPERLHKRGGPYDAEEQLKRRASDQPPGDRL